MEESDHVLQGYIMSIPGFETQKHLLDKVVRIVIGSNNYNPHEPLQLAQHSYHRRHKQNGIS